MSDAEDLVRARNEVDRLRQRWTEAAAQLQEVTTLLDAAMKRSCEILARTESRDDALLRRDELRQSAPTNEEARSPWFTVAEAANTARCAPNTIRKALHAEQLKEGSGLVGRQHTAPQGSWLIHMNALDAWITR